MAGGRLGGMRGGCGEWLVMGRGTSLATTEDHCSESWAFLGTGMDQRPDGRSLLSAAPISEIEVDEGNVDLQMTMRWCIGRSGNWGTGKLRSSSEGEQFGRDRPSQDQSKTRRNEGNAR